MIKNIKHQVVSIAQHGPHLLSSTSNVTQRVRRTHTIQGKQNVVKNITFAVRVTTHHQYGMVHLVHNGARPLCTTNMAVRHMVHNGARPLYTTNMAS